jgi:hypothetical protein
VTRTSKGRNAPIFCLPRIAALSLPLLCLFMALSAASAAPPRRLVLAPPPKLQEYGNLLLVDLSVSVDSEENLRDILKNGAVLELGVSITVTRLRSILSDEEMEKREYSSIIRHDPLSRDFLATVPEISGLREMKDKNLIRLLNASWRKLSLPSAYLSLLREQGPDEKFEVIVEISLRHTEVPPWLEKNFTFWDADVAASQKIVLPYTYLNRQVTDERPD